MYNEALEEKVYTKLKNVLEIYAKEIFIKVGELENTVGRRVMQNLTQVPEDGFSPLDKGEVWGEEEWQNLWVKGSFTVPAQLQGQALYAVSHAGGIEQMLYVEGRPVGIFNSKNDYVGAMHSAQRVTGGSQAGAVLHLALECFAGYFHKGNGVYAGYGQPDHALPGAFKQTYGGVDICVMDEEVKDFVFDVRELLQAAQVIPDNNFLKADARRVLNDISGDIMLYPANYTREQWKQGVRDALKKTRAFYAKGENSRIFGKVGIIGHSHMDTAWFWPIRETVRKCARTYANALSLMEQYPEYRFVQSSALHSDWMRTQYPSIFADMQRQVKAGRYEPNGGVYVECDCNITSGEFMIRQFLKGQLFTRKYFGYTADSFWLPDTFGYNGNIPQIMQGCGTKYFYTTKLSWNEQNTFPFESFIWQGIDGSKVLSHLNLIHRFPDTENCVLAIKELQRKSDSDMRLLAFGFGDGGGGPTYGMAESARRTMHMEGMPQVEYMTVSGFMQELEKRSEDLPVFHDELYLELHRGTLTQMHEVKRKNRKAEFAMRSMEYFNVLSGAPADKDADELCKTLLKNQFHDILPGTCSNEVYKLYNEEMTQLIDTCTQKAQDYAGRLTDGDACSKTVFNTLSFDRGDTLVLSDDGFMPAGKPVQRYTDLCGRAQLAVGDVEIPAFGHTVLQAGQPAPAKKSPFVYDGTTLHTPYACIRFDADGYMESYMDARSGRQLKKPGGTPLNALLLADDVPVYWDNWDIEKDTIDQLQPVHGFLGREVVCDGDVMLRLRSRYKVGDHSTLEQDMIFYADSPRIDFHTVIDWHEKHRLLKVGFDLDITAAAAKNEIQYGYVSRPTTRNNSLETAKFEVCNYKWTDVSESRFGAALLNDCKYGISVTDCNLRLSLHRGGTHPDTSGDEGVHEMTYALLVHDGSNLTRDVIAPAYMLNIPAQAVQGACKAVPALLHIDAENVICEAVKPAELLENTYVVRLYECEGTRTRARVTFGTAPRAVYLANMLEDAQGQLEAANGVSLQLHPFEIKTLLVKTAD